MGRLLPLAGGGLVGASCFLPWLSASISFASVYGTGDMSGMGTISGKVALALGLGALVLAALDLHAGEDRFRRMASGAAVLGAAIVVYKSWSLTSQLNEAVPGDIVGHVSLGIGMWVALVGGGLAFAGDYFHD